ncbi:MAG: right-handed parallel beta-helix repeat-containing protein [bacterium]|nr:right-handed parallel beta-helix repeat-containing protein [bacterium]
MICLLIIALFLTGTAAQSAVIELTPGLSITGAIESSSSGDTILLNDGLYVEAVRVHEHSVVIGSRLLLDGSAEHIENTILVAVTDNPDSASCVSVALPSSDSCTIRGLTMTGGEGTLWSSPDGDFAAGGAVFANESRLRVEDCVIRECQAQFGGGIAVEHPSPIQAITYATIERTQFANCAAEAYGGGLYLWRTATEIRFATFEACTSDAGGIQSIGAQITVSACTLRNCGSAVGAIFAGGDNSVVEDCLFESNGNPWTESEFGFCNLAAFDRVTIRGNIFRDNTTNDMAILVQDFDRFGVPFFYGNVIERHTMTDRSGAIYLSNCEGVFSHNIMRDCYSDRGASISPAGSGVLQIRHNVFVNNGQSPDGFGSVLNYSAASMGIPAMADSNVFAGNIGPAISFDPAMPGPVSINARNNWWGHQSGPYHPTRNPNGRGDTLLLELVEFEPWLTEPPDTSSAVPPRQPESVILGSTWEVMGVYPNPFNSKLSIDVAGFTDSSFKLALFDLLGRECATLYSGRMYGGTVSVTSPPLLASGVYFLVARDSRYMKAQKVVLLK